MTIGSSTRSSLVSSTCRLSSARVSEASTMEYHRKLPQPSLYFVPHDLPTFTCSFSTNKVDKSEEMIGSYAAQATPYEKKASTQHALLLFCCHHSMISFSNHLPQSISPLTVLVRGGTQWHACPWSLRCHCKNPGEIYRFCLICSPMGEPHS